MGYLVANGPQRSLITSTALSQVMSAPTGCGSRVGPVDADWFVGGLVGIGEVDAFSVVLVHAPARVTTNIPTRRIPRSDLMALPSREVCNHRGPPNALPFSCNGLFGSRYHNFRRTYSSSSSIFSRNGRQSHSGFDEASAVRSLWSSL